MDSLKILYIDTNAFCGSDFLGLPFLKDEDLAYLKNIRVESVRHEKEASAYFKNRYIKDHYRGEHDKPLSKNGYFNISHSYGFVVFIMDDSPIGIDVERIKSPKEDVIKYVSSNEELDYITDGEKFAQVWTNKESLLKAIGVGITGDLKGVPSLPLNGKKEYLGHTYISKSLRFNDYIISVTRLSESDFDLVIEKENIDLSNNIL